MAVGPILAVLSNIPWGTVVENAPKIADGASRLWSTVTRQKKSDKATIVDAEAALPSSLPEADDLRIKLRELEEGVRHLNEQMQLSSAVIKDLAEQNAVLVQRVEQNRLRLLRSIKIGGGVVLTLSAAVIFLLIGGA